MKFRKLLNLLTEAFSKKLYHGTRSDFAELKKNQYGIIWLAFDKEVALEYAKEKYYVKTSDIVLEVTLKSNAKIVDFRDLKNKYIREVYDSISSTYKMNFGLEMSEKDWYNDRADFGTIEANLWIIDFLKSKRIDGIILRDANTRQKHLSVALFNQKKIENATPIK